MRDYFRVYAKVDLDHIAHNLRAFKKRIGSNKQVMVIIKADGYGHGAIPIATELKEEIDRIGVATIQEAIALRKSDVHHPILILGYTCDTRYEEILSYNINPTIFQLTSAKKLSKVATKAGKIAKIHIKIDTGMGRIGFKPNEQSIEEITKINELPNIEIEGIFTHFAKADETDKAFTQQQIRTFNQFIKALEDKQISIPIKHASNSAGIIDHENAHMDLVRAGIALYGLYPSKNVQKSNVLIKPALSLISHVVYVKEVEAGMGISYGSTYITDKTSKIATIPVGYGDGYPRLLSSKGGVLIRGQYAPILGRICMDQFMVDVTEIDDIKSGDEVVLIGTQGKHTITVDDIADHTGTINYEIVCQLGKRIPRVYYKNGEYTYSIDYF